MKKILSFAIVMLLSFCFLSVAKVSAEENTYNSSSATTLVYSADGGIAYVKDMAHGEILDVNYPGDGLTITDSNAVFNVKGHVTNIYRIKAKVYFSDGTSNEISRLCHNDGSGLSMIDENGYFEYHGNLGLEWIGMTITKIHYQVYMTDDNSAARNGELQVLGMHFDADGSYSSFAELYGNEGSEEPTPDPEPTPSEGPAFTAASGATGEGNVFTMTGTRANLEAEVQAEVTEPTYVSVKYNATQIDNFDIYVTAAAADGTSTEILVAAEAPGSWNKTEVVEGEGYNIVTIQTGDYLIGYASISKVRLYIRGYEGTVFEVLDFAITADGVHGFDSTSGSETPEPTPDPDPVLPEGELSIGKMTTTASADVATITDNANGEQVVTYSTSPGWNTFDIPVANYTSDLHIFEISFTASAEVVLFYKVNGVEMWGDLGYVTYPGGSVQTQTIDLSSMELPTDFAISLLIDASAVVEAEKTITIHSVTLEAPVVEPDDGQLRIGDITTSASATITKNESGEQVITYATSPGFSSFKMDVENYDVNLSVLEIKFTANTISVISAASNKAQQAKKILLLIIAFCLLVLFFGIIITSVS